MSAKLNCPECKTENNGPAEGEHKITCTNCSLIIVLKKKPAATAKPAEASAPEIRRRASTPKRRRSRGDAQDDAKPSSRRSSRGRAPTSSRQVTRLGKIPELDEAETGGRRGSRGRRQAPARKKMSPAVLWSGIGATAAIIGIVIFMATRGDDDADQSTKDTKKKVAKAEATTENTDSTNDLTANSNAGDGNAAASDSGETAPTKTAPKKKAQEKPKVDKSAWKTAFFEATPGTTTEQVDAIKKSVAILADLTATRTIGDARFQLMEKPRQSIPFLINALMRFNWADKDDVSRAWQTIQVLEDVAERREDDDREFMVMSWNGPETPAGAKEVQYRMFAVRGWWRWWTGNNKSWKPAPIDEDG